MNVDLDCRITDTLLSLTFSKISKPVQKTDGAT